MDPQPRDLQYIDLRIARLYDPLNSRDHDFVFYERRIGEEPKRVLDLGCGTGTFATRLAKRGHDVVGVDPSAAMLTIARERSGTELVTWIEGIASDVPVSPPFDYATMMGHAFQTLLTEPTIQATLVAVRQRLVPGGAFMFESRNPAAQAWLKWNPEDSRISVEIAGIGEIESYEEVVSVESEIVTFDSYTHFASDGASYVSQEKLRFMTRAEIADHLRRAGYGEVEWIGDWNGTPFDEATSREIIVIARKPRR